MRSIQNNAWLGLKFILLSMSIQRKIFSSFSKSNIVCAADSMILIGELDFIVMFSEAAPDLLGKRPYRYLSNKMVIS